MTARARKSPRAKPPADERAIYLSEYLTDLNAGAGFLERLTGAERERLAAAGSRQSVSRGEGLFFQGDRHTGIWIIESGRLRTFYVGASGREMTLAYWTPGHFVGGPEVFGGGNHVWSADAPEDSTLLFLPGATLRTLATECPAIGLAIIDGLVAKGKCYSALVQLLGTRSISDRLRLLLRAMAETHGQPCPEGIRIDRAVTQEQFAMMVGSTRQWISVSLDRMQTEGLILLSRKTLILRQRFFETVSGDVPELDR